MSTPVRIGEWTFGVGAFFANLYVPSRFDRRKRHSGTVARGFQPLRWPPIQAAGADWGSIWITYYKLPSGSRGQRASTPSRTAARRTIFPTHRRTSQTIALVDSLVSMLPNLGSAATKARTGRTHWRGGGIRGTQILRECDSEGPLLSTDGPSSRFSRVKLDP